MIQHLKDKILSKKAVIGVIGLGYVGLSLLEAFGNAGYSLVGFDIDKKRVDSLKSGVSYFNFLPLDTLLQKVKTGHFEPSYDESILDKADVILISVPTSLDTHHLPDLSCLEHAFQAISRHLKENLLVILQSTTYPGTTEEELLPILKNSPFQVGTDIFLSYVPEVSDPGNKNYSLSSVPKTIGGISKNCLELTSLLYESLGCKIVACSSTKVAESAKLLQNTFRLVNIAFINEMKISLDQMGIDIWEVIEAASSKPFGFMPFYPGPGIGGDCIPVDPSYFIWKAKTLDGHTSLVELAESINSYTPNYVCEKVIHGLNLHNKSINGSKILILGVAYKKDVNDIRESAALKILSILQDMGANLHYNDPFIQSLSSIARYPKLDLKSEALDYENLKSFDCVVIVTDHSCYDWNKVVQNSRLIVDTHNVTASIENAHLKVIKA